MTNIFFVRHAHSIYTPDERERPLSDKGKIEASKVTDILKKQQIDVVFSSPYKRAYQTVQGIAEHLNQNVYIIENLKERRLAAQPVKNFDTAIKRVWGDLSFALEGGETGLDAQRRGIAVINDILDQHACENIVIGTHGNIMVLIMHYFDKRYGYPFWQQLQMPDIYKLTFNGRALEKVTKIWK